MSKKNKNWQSPKLKKIFIKPLIKKSAQIEAEAAVAPCGAFMSSDTCVPNLMCSVMENVKCEICGSEVIECTGYMFAK